jgi:poly-beta-1,6-N-acetyl-D-glucosamine synthase
MLLWLCIVIIFYIYAGYPLLLFLFSSLKTHLESFPYTEPSVTLLIAAYNEAVIIKKKLANSLEINYPKESLQIIVAADGSDDGTEETVREYAPHGIELLYDPVRAGKMAAINRAMPHARGAIVVFSDANNMFDPDAISKLIAPFSDPAVGCTTGAKLILKGDGLLDASEGLYWRYESFIRKHETETGSCTGVNGEIFAVRRELFEPPPAHIINDDHYIALQIIRKGFKVVYVPEARSFERASLTAADEIERRARIIAGRYQIMAAGLHLLPLNRPFVAWQIISHKYLRPFVPFIMILALVLNIMAVLPPLYGSFLFSTPYPANWMILFLQGLFYCLAFAGNSFKLKGASGKLLYIPTFLFNSNFAAIAGLFRYLAKRQTVLWKKLERQG